MSKKICDICGKEVGFLSQRKLKDGIVCSDCMQKLGKDFSIYSESFSKEQIRKGISGELELIPPVKCQCTNGVLVIDSTNRVLYMSLPLMQKSEEISLDAVVGYTYNEDEKQYGVGHTVGGAVVGGLLFSGVGAVIGSVIGANPGRKIKKISIDITYEVNGQCKLFTACLYNGKPIKPSGLEYKSCMQNAKIVMGQLDMLLKKKETAQTETVNIASNVSAADEIRKFKSLLDDGIITEGEFTKKKNQLLGTEVYAETAKEEKTQKFESVEEPLEKQDGELKEYLIKHYYPKNKVEAVKYYREVTGNGIIEAKKYIDDLFESAENL